MSKYYQYKCARCGDFKCKAMFEEMNYSALCMIDEIGHYVYESIYGECECGCNFIIVTELIE